MRGQSCLELSIGPRGDSSSAQGCAGSSALTSADAEIDLS
jgi:hypothetical protein